MRTMWRLGGLDWSRHRYALLLWWLFCGAYLLLGLAYIWADSPHTSEWFQIVAVGSYLFIAVLVGMTIQTFHPGWTASFFRVKPVRRGELWWSRLLWIFAVLLGPLYLAQLAPLLWVEPKIGPVSAFSVHFWSLHGAGVCLLAVVAAGSSRLSSYLLRALFVVGILIAVAMLFSRLAHRESNWWLVASPEVAELLWQAGLSVTGAVIFAVVCIHFYRGRRSWKVQAGAMGSALVLAAAWGPFEFRTDIDQVGHPVGSEVDLSQAVYRADRDHPMSAFRTQRNREPGGYSTYSQSIPPYRNGGEERFWFIRGRFEIEGIDPAVAYSARLLEARWIAPDGTVLPYAPPPGTYAIRNSSHSLPPPLPTAARMQAFFGANPNQSVRAAQPGGAPILLFGAWTSDYERYQDKPGRLEMRLRVDFYTHRSEVAFRLRKEASTLRHDGLPIKFAGYSFKADELLLRTTQLQAASRWQIPLEDRWSNGGQWMLYHPETGRRSSYTGGGYARFRLLGSIRVVQKRMKFNPDFAAMPDLSDPEALRLVRIDGHYLGSTEVRVVTEDFPLVTQESIEPARSNGGNESDGVSIRLESRTGEEAAQ